MSNNEELVNHVCQAHTFHGEIVALIILISTVPRFHKKLRKYNSKRRGKNLVGKTIKLTKIS